MKIRLRLSTPLGLCLLAAGVSGCPAQKKMEVPPGQPAVVSSVPAGQSAKDAAKPRTGSNSEALRPDGSPCFLASQCFSAVCEGASCDDSRPGTCVPEDRACTADLVEYCGCDGKTFVSSSSCPGEPFSVKGKCPEGAEASEP